MGIVKYTSISTMMLSVWAPMAVLAQTTSMSTSNPADGLTTSGAGSATATVGTVLVDGTSSTYRVIQTLPPAIDESPPILPNINDPKAVNAQGVCSGYTASNVVNNAYGFTADLTLAGKSCNVYGTDINNLQLSVQYQNADRLNVRIVPTSIDASNASHFIVPSRYLYQPTLDSDANSTTQMNDLQFTWTNEPSFGFSVLRRSTGDVLFDTKGSSIVFENQFLEFVTAMPSNYNVYGLGETIHGLRLGNNFTKTIYAADAGDPIDGNIYGSHPFLLDTRYYETNPENGNMTLLTSGEYNASAEYTSLSHGIFLRNAHGQEILMKPNNITWRTLGGSIDLYFLSGPSQPEVTRQYQAGIIGLPAMQKYNAFGYHQCRWGYTNWTEMQDVVDNFRRFDIPLEYIWNDIDYMYAYRNWDNDPIRFGVKEGAEFLSRLHAAGQNYVPIVDAAIYHPAPNNASDAYASYSRGNESGAFMTNPDGSQYIGAVWPGFTVFPDWRANSTQAWWTGEFQTYHSQIAFDGIWLDMNEASSFCIGSCGSGRVNDNQVHPPFGLPGEAGNIVYDYPEGFNITNSTEAAAASSASVAQASSVAATAMATSSTTSYLRTTPTPGVRSVDYPPYVLNNVNGALPVHAITPNATHADGVIEYDIHNLWGHEEVNATYNALLEVFPGKRPFIISRSQFAGTGTKAGHWGGDNTSKWYYMYFSIPQALSMSLFGIPFFGVDTCGFNGNSDEELCNRWMQLSAFFPFYRNHNTLSANSQEPYIWESVTVASKTAMNIRYSILPYMYTLLYLAHSTGDTVMRALAWEFSTEPELANADRQFMLGPSLMVTPVLEPQATTVNGIFPGVGSGTVWYDWYNQTAVTAGAGQNVTIAAPLGHIPVYIKGGSVIPMQQPGYTTDESRRNQWSLLVALNMEGSATGQLYLDDGESVTPNATRFVDMTVTGGSLYANGRGTFNDSNALANITILGVPYAPTNATFNGAMLSGLEYNETSRVVSITGLENMTSMGAWNADWTLSWS